MARKRLEIGQVRGGPCCFSSEWTDERCGAEADLWCAAANCYLCLDHYAIVTAMFTAAAVEMMDDMISDVNIEFSGPWPDAHGDGI